MKPIPYQAEDRGEQVAYTAQMTTQVLVNKDLLSDEKFDLDSYLQRTLRQNFGVLLTEEQ